MKLISISLKLDFDIYVNFAENVSSFLFCYHPESSSSSRKHTESPSEHFIPVSRQKLRIWDKFHSFLIIKLPQYTLM